MKRNEDEGYNCSAGPLLTVKGFAAKYDWPIGGLRHLIFQKPDGFEDVLRKVGSKVLIHEQSFFDWIDKVNGIDPQGERK